MPNHIFEYIRKWEQLPVTSRKPLFQDERVVLSSLDLHDSLFIEISQYTNELSKALSSTSVAGGTFDSKYKALLAAISYKIDLIFEENDWKDLQIFKNKSLLQAKYELALDYLNAIIARTSPEVKTLLFKDLVRRSNEDIADDTTLTEDSRQAQIETNNYNKNRIDTMDNAKIEEFKKTIDENKAKLKPDAIKYFEQRFSNYATGNWNSENEFAKHQEYNFLLDLEYYLKPKHTFEALSSTEFIRRADGGKPTVDELKTAFDRKGKLNKDSKLVLYTPERINNFIEIIDPTKKMSMRERLLIGGAASSSANTLANRATELTEDDNIKKVLRIMEVQNIIAPGVLMLLAAKGEFRLASPTANELSPASKENILQLKSKYQYEFLLQNLYLLKTSYKALKRTSNLKKIDNLIAKVEALQNKNISNEDRYNNARAELLKAFEVEQKSLNFGFLYRRSKLDFINNINADTNTHHYPRLLALALKKTYLDSLTTASNLPVSLGLYDRTEKAMMAIEPVKGSKFYKQFDFSVADIKSLVNK